MIIQDLTQKLLKCEQIVNSFYLLLAQFFFNASLSDAM